MGVEIAGTSEGFDFVDILFDYTKPVEILFEAFKYWLRYLKSFNSVIVWNWLDDNSLSYKFLTRSKDVSLCDYSEAKANYVKLQFASNYDNYFRTLSKNARQNIRTAYNRLNKSLKRLNVEILTGDQISQSSSRRLRKQFEKIYIDRHTERYGSSRLRQLIKSKFHYTSSLLDCPHSFVAVVYIDETVGAYMEGYINPDKKSIVVPVLCINDEFRFFSPGIILVNETIKYLIDNNFETLDLVRGTEQYKFQMGGVLYHPSNLKISIL